MGERRGMAASKWTAITAVFVFVIAWLTFLVNLPSQAVVHRDEANWTRVSLFAFRTFFIDRDFDHPDWAAEFNRFGSTNPQIGKYILGASQWAAGFHDFDGIVDWQQGQGMRWHIENGYIPGPERLYAARLPVAALGALTAVLTHLIIALYLPGGTPLAGLFAAALFVTAPLAADSARLAMVDMPATAFSLLTLFCGLAAWQNRAHGRRFLLLIGATAVAAALAAGTKMSNLFAWVAPPLILVVLQGLGWWGWRGGRPLPWRRFFAALAVLLALPALIFVLSNPFLYRDTLAGLRHMAGLNEQLALERAAFPDIALYGPADRLGAMLRHAYGGGAWPSLQWAFSLPGLIYIGWMAWRGDRAALILLLWTAVCAGSLLAGIHLARERWYLPLVPLAAIHVVMGVAGPVHLLRNKARGE